MADAVAGKVDFVHAEDGFGKIVRDGRQAAKFAFDRGGIG